MHLSRPVVISYLMSTLFFLVGWTYDSGKTEKEKEQKKSDCIASFNAIAEGRKIKEYKCDFGTSSFGAKEIIMDAQNIDLEEAVLIADKSLQCLAKKQMNLNVAMMAPRIRLNSSEIKGAGYMAITDIADIRCEKCDFEEMLFFGPPGVAWWYLNHNRCEVKDHRLVCPDPKRAALQRETCTKILEDIQQKPWYLDCVLGCGHGDFVDLNDNLKNNRIIRLQHKAFQNEYIKMSQVPCGIYLDVVMLANHLKLQSSTIVLKGYYLAVDSGSIACETCDLDGALFFGTGSWTLNGKQCIVDKNHHLQCP